jgi:hypothetical protein
MAIKDQVKGMVPIYLKVGAIWTTFGFLLARPCVAETPEEVFLRLERGRRNDAVEERRRQETLEWQKRRKEEEYSARWKRYGDFEIDVMQWHQQKDGVWITVAKYGLLVGTNGGLSWPSDENSPKTPANLLVLPEPPLPLRWGQRSQIGVVAPLRPDPARHAPRRFDQSLEALVKQGVITPKERCLASQSSTVCKEIEMSNWIGVSCGSLHFNKKIAGQPWGKWERPLPRSNEERLVVDRCSSNGGRSGGATEDSR